MKTIAQTQWFAALVSALALGTLFGPLALGDNLHLIESRPTGFAIYRSGKPSEQDFRHWCKIGIDEVYVLSGNAATAEDTFSQICPRIKVLASEAQDVDQMPDGRLLQLFDQWVENAQKKNKKILFRCNCGCHRTGRMAAYYQMKYQNLTPEDAIALMNTYGSMMVFHPQLPQQVRELYALIQEQRKQATTKH